MLILFISTYHRPGDSTQLLNIIKMQFTLATVVLLAGLAVALPAGSLNAQEDAACTELKVVSNNEFAAGAVQNGQAFTDAVDSIVKSGNKNETAVLKRAGAIDNNNKPVEADAADAN